jgi:hypothetical protein
MAKHYHVLNLGAGVQSTALALLANEGRLLDEHDNKIVLDCAIFADTGEEPTDPGHSVLDHLEWIKRTVSFPIIVRSAGRLGEHLMWGTNMTGGRFASIPAFTKKPDGMVSKTPRQCTSEYKVQVVEKAIRRDVLGLLPRKRIPRDVTVFQYIGISVDEVGRMLRAKKRALEKPSRWSVLRYPLVEVLNWSRKECREYLLPRVPHRVPRSACTFCPFHSNEEWAKIKERNGADWKRVIEIDSVLRRQGAVVNRNMNSQMFLHRSCMPIDQIDFGTDKNSDREMAGECLGMCGN